MLISVDQKYIAERLNEYGWTEEMLARADYFVPVKLPTPVPYFERPWCCFENSFNHAEQTGLLYVEGIAVSPSGISIHAWNSTNGSDVIDYTWPYQHVNKYFGIIFPIKWVKKHYSTPGGILNPKLLRTKPLPPVVAKPALVAGFYLLQTKEENIFRYISKFGH